MRLSEKRRAVALRSVEELLANIRSGYYDAPDDPAVKDPLVALTYEQVCLAHDEKRYQELSAEWREAMLFHNYGPETDFWATWQATFSCAVSDVVVLWALRVKKEFDDGQL